MNHNHITLYGVGGVTILITKILHEIYISTRKVFRHDRHHYLDLPSFFLKPLFRIELNLRSLLRRQNIIKTTPPVSLHMELIKTNNWWCS